MKKLNLEYTEVLVINGMRVRVDADGNPLMARVAYWHSPDADRMAGIATRQALENVALGKAAADAKRSADAHALALAREAFLRLLKRALEAKAAEACTVNAADLQKRSADKRRQEAEWRGKWFQDVLDEHPEYGPRRLANDTRDLIVRRKAELVDKDAARIPVSPEERQIILEAHKRCDEITRHTADGFLKTLRKS